MSQQQLKLLKRWVAKFWVFSPERLWLLSIALRVRGRWILAFWIKQLNTFLYHNSLAPGASVAPDIYLGHNSIGIVVSSEVVIGRRVNIWQNVTLSAGRPPRAHSSASVTPADDDAAARARKRPSGPRSRIVIEDGVAIGANAVLIAPRGGTLRIGRGARVGAGTVVTQDVPAGATIVGAPARLLLRDPTDAKPTDADQAATELSVARAAAEELLVTEPATEEP